MKRQLTLLICVLLALPIFAASVIQRDFLGCSLGNTTRAEYIQNMLKIGGQLVEYNEAGVSFDGDFEILGHHMSICSAIFMNDTLMTIAFFDSISDPIKVSNFKNTIKAQYAGVKKSGTDDFVVNMTIDTIMNQLNLAPEQIWSKVDDKSAIILLEGRHNIGVMYLDSWRLLGEVISSMSKKLSDLAGPDFDEANAVNSVAGITFGAAKADVLPQLIRKFGSPLEENEHEIKFSNAVIGGIQYNIVIFSFAYNNATKRQEFISASFQRSFNSWEDDVARASFTNVVSTYARKYTNENKKRDNYNDKLYLYGKIDNGYYPISISLQKSVSRGGEMRWYVVVDYFLHKTAHLYDDEI